MHEFIRIARKLCLEDKLDEAFNSLESTLHSEQSISEKLYLLYNILQYRKIMNPSVSYNQPGYFQLFCVFGDDLIIEKIIHNCSIIISSLNNDTNKLPSPFLYSKISHYFLDHLPEYLINEIKYYENNQENHLSILYFFKFYLSFKSISPFDDPLLNFSGISESKTPSLCMFAIAYFTEMQQSNRNFNYYFHNKKQFHSNNLLDSSKIDYKIHYQSVEKYAKSESLLKYCKNRHNFADIEIFTKQYNEQKNSS